MLVSPLEAFLNVWCERKGFCVSAGSGGERSHSGGIPQGPAGMLQPLLYVYVYVCGNH